MIKSATHHLDEKENMLTGKPPKFRNNNTVFHDGLLFSHAEKSKFILTLRDPVQEPANKRAEQTSGIGGERKILAFCPPPPLAIQGPGTLPGLSHFPQQPPPLVVPKAQAPSAGLPGRNPICPSLLHTWGRLAWMKDGLEM